MDVVDDEPRHHPDRVLYNDHVVEPAAAITVPVQAAHPTREVVSLAVAQVLLGAAPVNIIGCRVSDEQLGQLFSYLPERPRLWRTDQGRRVADLRDDAVCRQPQCPIIRPNRPRAPSMAPSTVRHLTPSGSEEQRRGRAATNSNPRPGGSRCRVHHRLS